MRIRLITASLMTLLVLHSPAHAQGSTVDDVVKDVIEQIKDDGYTIVEVGRSWFGRIVITANNIVDLREIVLDRKSGEVLRDQRFPIRKIPGRPTTPTPPGPGSSGGPPGLGGVGGHGGG